MLPLNRHTIDPKPKESPMNDFNDRRIMAAASAIYKELNTQIPALQTRVEELAAGLAYVAVTAADRVTPDDHVDHEVVDEMLRASGDLPPAPSEDMAAARAQAADRAPSVTVADLEAHRTFANLVVSVPVNQDQPVHADQVVGGDEHMVLGHALHPAQPGQVLGVRLTDEGAAWLFERRS